MPRSGTSLLEQILASYPGVHGAGELTDLQDVIVSGMPNAEFLQFPEAALNFTAEDFRHLGEQYTARLWQHAPEAERITDKMPANFFYLGMIRLMLPNAKIIHAMRDPMDSCFSCYSRLFSKDSVNFSYDLGTLGQYYARYEKLMRHWRSALPEDAILNLRYEDMVADTEGQARRMLAFLGLPWDDRCLDFHQNERRVSTASSAQVRKPIYQTSVARWEKFAGHLAPLWRAVRNYRDLPLPHNAQTLHQLGIGCHRMGDDLQAIELIEKSLAADPSRSDAHNDLGGLLAKQGKPDLATASFRTALSLDPCNSQAYYNLGCTLQEQGRMQEAENCYRQSLAIRHDAIEVLCNLGGCLQKQGKLLDAESCLRQAIAIDPNYAQAHNNLGVTLGDLGRQEEAVRSFEAAIFLKPDFIDAHYNLSQLKTYREGDGQLPVLEQQRARLDELTLGTRINYWFALGKIYEDLGRHDQSFAAYREGNGLKFASITYNEEAEAAWTERIPSIFSREFFAGRDFGNSTAFSEKAPIFIVGMPRSGTTLLEQILASYPDIHGAGELYDLREVVTAAMPGALFEGFPDAVPGLSAADFGRLGEQYAERVWRHAPEAIRITDKMPANFFYLGMIHLMLPNAKIIHAMRDPMDSCFSCYSRLFDHHNVGFTYNLETLGRYYQRYIKLMQHWHAVLPAGRILDVRYEDMVADTEGQARRLLEYLGLPWDERCLMFHQNKRRVITASAAQVRKPIYRSSLARWEKYAGHLAPLWNLVKDHRDLPNPHNAQTLHRLGIGIHRTGDNAGAIALIEQAITVDPGVSSFHNDLGGLFNKQGEK
ncbi:MAG: sulfotransferase, partial [Burkholderiaceae bacterium]|nr:sulfotransferase [Burkholderiaceae bacterium]